jgi:hypothetical protein
MLKFLYREGSTILKPQNTYIGDADSAGGCCEKSNFGRGPLGLFPKTQLKKQSQEFMKYTHVAYK